MFSSRKSRQSTEPSSSDPPKTPTLRKLSPPHTLPTFSKKRSLPPVPSDEKRHRTESSEGLRTPPRVAKPALSLRDYAQIEKERNFDAYKQREKSVMQSLPSLDDLQLPKLPSRNGAKMERKEGVETQNTSQESKENGKTHKQVVCFGGSNENQKSKEDREKLARKQRSEIDLLLSESYGCHCKGKCSNRKCPCRNYGKVCSANCSCNKEKCVNIARASSSAAEVDETVVDSS